MNRNKVNLSKKKKNDVFVCPLRSRDNPNYLTAFADDQLLAYSGATQ